MTTDTIRVFCACAPDGLDAESQAVVEYTIRKRASRPVDLTWMRLSRDPGSPFYADCDERTVRGWDTRNWATPFSWFRWAIPHLCGYEGRAVYCDSDVLWRDDVAKLVDAPIPAGKAFVAKSPQRLCVSVFDCAAMKPLLPEWEQLRRFGPLNVKNFRETAWTPFPRGEEWNNIDGEGRPLTENDKVVHYSDIAMQPQLPAVLKRLAAEGRSHWFEAPPVPHVRPELVALFDRALDEALAAGYTLDRYDQQPRYGRIVKRVLAEYRGGPRQTVAPGTTSNLGRAQ